MGLRYRIASAVSRRSRENKLAYLRAHIPESSSVLLLGVSRYSGGFAENLIEQGMARHAAWAIGLMYEPLLEGPPLDIRLVRGDARCLPFGDDSFDYVISNAVIEHVGGPGQARRMIAEAERVARRGVFHTTPNRRFLIETHTQVPLLHWLPRRHQDRVFSLVGKQLPLDFNWLFSGRSLRQVVGSQYTVVHRPMTLIASRRWP